MAKKSTGRLAGLAALAATAYMLNKGKGEAKAGAKDTAADREDADMGKAMRDNMAASKKADDITVSGEGGFDAPADMSRVSRVGTPASVTRSEKAPSASATPASSRTERFAPSGSPVLSDNPRKTGNAKAVVAQGGNRSTRSDMQSDGGKSVVDRQNAGAKKAGLSVDDYFTSGKAQIDKQDESGTAAKPTPVTTDETKLSLSDRIKLSRERARSGSGQTDTRSVNERLSSMKKGGAVKKMASGGMTSQRGDGIASKGKTRCKMY